jgi:hypothetical protein
MGAAGREKMIAEYSLKKSSVQLLALLKRSAE